MKINNLQIFILLIFLSVFTSASALAERHVLLLPLYTTAEEGSEKAAGNEDTTSLTFNKVCDVLSKKTGDDYECKTIFIQNNTMLVKEELLDFIDRIESEDFSIIYLSGNDFYMLERAGYDKLKPAMQISIQKKTADQACFYTRESDNINDIEDLRGKKWGGSYFHMGTRFLLYKLGVDEPLEDFFGKIIYRKADLWEDLGPLLLDGTIDVFTGSISLEAFGRAKDKEFVKIKKTFCTDYRNTHILAFHEDSMTVDQMGEVRKLFLKAHKDKDFGSFGFIFAVIQGHFVPFDPEVYKITKDYIDTSIKRGWLQDLLNFMKENE